MTDLVEHLKAEAARNQRLAEKAETSKRRRVHAQRAKHLQRAATEIDCLQAKVSEREAAFDLVEKINGELQADLAASRCCHADAASMVTKLGAEIEQLRRSVHRHTWVEVYLADQLAGTDKVVHVQRRAQAEREYELRFQTKDTPQATCIVGRNGKVCGEPATHEYQIVDGGRWYPCCAECAPYALAGAAEVRELTERSKCQTCDGRGAIPVTPDGMAEDACPDCRVTEKESG